MGNRRVSGARRDRQSRWRRGPGALPRGSGLRAGAVAGESSRWDGGGWLRPGIEDRRALQRSAGPCRRCAHPDRSRLLCRRYACAGLPGRAACGVRRLPPGIRQLRWRDGALYRSHGQATTHGHRHCRVHLRRVRISCDRPGARADRGRIRGDRHTPCAAHGRPTRGDAVMSPAAALASGVFLAYARLAVIVLSGAGFLLFVLTYAFGKQIDSIWRTFRGWLVILPIVLACIFAGRGATIVGVALLAMTAFKEFARATGLYRDWWMTGAVHCGIIALAVTSFVRDPWLDLPGWYGLFMALPV